MKKSLGPSLADAAVSVLLTAEAADKAMAAQDMARDWRAHRLHPDGRAIAPERPARPKRPELLAPRDLPRRRIGADVEGRVALLHALAHIELNAIDLAVDLLVRFPSEEMPPAFFDDWVRIADEEAKHYLMLAGRLRSFGASYGDLPAHDGLWQAAMDTSSDLLARLALVPMVLEARGLDVTPGMIEKLIAVGDRESADILQVIYEDEIGHVACGKRWFDDLAGRRGLDPKEAWQKLVREGFKGRLKPPFNENARDAANFPSDFYRPLASPKISG